MAEDDALIKLKVDDSSLNEQFAKVEQSLKNLGSVNLTGLTNTFSKLSSELQASAGVLEKYSGSLSTLSTQAGKVATAESSLAKAAKTSADAVEAAELKKQTALAKATRLWEQEAAKQTALADKQAAIEAKTAIAVQAAANKEAANSLILMKAYTELNAAKVRQGEAAQLAAQLQVEANQRAIASEYARQQSLVASLGLYERMAAASLSTRAQQDIMQGYSRHEASGPHPSVFAAGPGILGNSLDEQKQAKQGIQAYRSQLRGLRSEIEGFKGLNNWGGSLAQRPEFAEFSKGDMKTYLSTVSSELDKQGMELRARPNFLQKEIGYIGRMAISWVALGAAIEVAMVAVRTYDESVKEAAEFQVQGVMFGAYQQSRQSSGQKTDNTNQNDVLRESIQLAAQYGDSVNDVAQDMNLWYKRTGDQNSAIYMTSQALEFQNATGTKLQDTYRVLTALGEQLSGQKMGLGDKSATFDLSKTHQLLQMITAAAVSAGAGLHDLGPEGHNSAVVLAEAIEKDGAAMKSFGFSTLETVAINQAAIRSFGNTGQAAGEAAEKIGRIMGGLASFSDPNKTAKLMKFGIDVSGFNSNEAIGAQKNVLEQLAAVYEKLTPANQKFLATQTTGARQYEQLIAILDTLKDAKQVELETQKNMSLEDQLAAEMQDTYQIQLKKTQGAWEGLEIAVGQGMLPVLQETVSYIASTVIPTLAGMGEAAANVAQLISLSFAQDKLAISQEAADVVDSVPYAVTGKHLGSYMKGQGSRDARQEVLNQNFQDLGARVNAENSGPVTKKFGKQSRTWVNEAAFESSKATQFGAPSMVPGYLQGHEADYAVQNTGNTYNQALTDSIAKNLKNMNLQQNSEQGPLTQNGLGGAGKLKDYQIAGEALSDLRNRYQDLTEAIAENKNTVEGAIASDKTRIQTFGLTSATLSPLLKDFQQKKRGDSSEISQLQPYEVQTQSLADSYKSRANKAGLGTTEGKGFLNAYYGAESEARNIRREISGLKKDMEDVNNEADHYRETLAKTNIDGLLKGQATKFSQLDKQFNDSKSAGSKSVLSGKMENQAENDRKVAMEALSHWPVALQGSVAYNDELQRINDTYVSTKEKADAAEQSSEKFAKSLADSMSKGMFSSQQKGLDELVSFSKGSGTDNKKSQEIADQIKLVRELQDEYVRYNEQLTETAGNTALTDQASQLHTLNDSVIMVGFSLDQFKQKLEALQNSDWYRAVSDGFTEIGKALEKSIDNSIFTARADANIGTIDSEITALNQLKEINDEMYSLSAQHSAMDNANHKLALVQIQQQTEELKQQAAFEQNRLAHPSFITSTLQSTTQGYLQNYMKNLQSSLMGNIGGGNTEQAQANTALQDYTKATTGALTTNVGTFKDAVTLFGSSANNLKTLLGQAPTSGLGSSAQSPSELALVNSFNPSGGQGGSLYVTPDTSDQAGPTNARAAAMGLPISNSALTGQNLGGGSASDNQATSQAQHTAGALGTISGVAAALALSNTKSPIGNALTIIGGSMTGGSAIPKSFSGSGLSGLSGLFGGSGGTMSAQSAPVDVNLVDSTGNPVLNSSGTSSDILNPGVSATYTGAGGATGSPLGSVGADASTLGTVLNAFSTSAASGFGSVAGGAFGAILGGPLGMSIGSSLGGIIGSIFGPKYSTTTNPDMYANDGYAAGLANAVGTSYTSANGTTLEDPTLQQGLGGQDELQYIDAFVKAHPGGSGLSGASLTMWQTANTETGGGAAVGAGGLHQGNLGLTDAAGNVIPNTTQNWQALLQGIQNTTQQLVTFNGGLNAANASLVVFNQYGSGQASIPGAWNTPGYQAPSTNYTLPGSAAGSNVTSNTATPLATTNTSTASTGVIQLSNTTVLDGKQIAQSVQSYNIRAAQQGYARVT